MISTSTLTSSSSSSSFFLLLQRHSSRFVQRRQKKVMNTAKRTNAIVKSLFPANVRDRMMKDAEEQLDQKLAAKKKGVKTLGAAPKNQLKSFLSDDNKNKDGKGVDHDGNITFDSKPIADLFPKTTVMFGGTTNKLLCPAYSDGIELVQFKESCLTLLHFSDIQKILQVLRPGQV